MDDDMALPERSSDHCPTHGARPESDRGWCRAPFGMGVASCGAKLLPMDDEQLAARRAEIPVHCAACGGEYPGTTELHNGICDACHKLTHGPNYRLVAKLQDQEREIARLRTSLQWALRIVPEPQTDHNIYASNHAEAVRLARRCLSFP